MRKMSISSTLTATGTGADDAARWKALALNAAPQIKTVLDGELTGFTPTGSSYIGGENDETQLTYRNKALGYDLVVGVRGANPQFGIVYYIRYNGKVLYTHSCNDRAYSTRSSDNKIETDFRVAVYNIDDIVWYVGIERHNYSDWYYGEHYYIGTHYIALTAFKGSYDGETYVMYNSVDDDELLIESATMPLPVQTFGSTPDKMNVVRASDGAVNGPNKHDFVDFARTGAMPAPKTGYFWYPECWYGTFKDTTSRSVTNFGLALFNGNKVFYTLWDAATNLRVTTEPQSIYTVSGKSFLAVSRHLIVAADPPLRMLQKPGEVLEW